MRAEWRIKGIYKADAQKVADEIGDKKVTPQEILEKARDETSELHKCFEWDDSVAAERYRLQQAGNLSENTIHFPNWNRYLKQWKAFNN